MKKSSKKSYGYIKQKNENILNLDKEVMLWFLFIERDVDLITLQGKHYSWRWNNYSFKSEGQEILIGQTTKQNGQKSYPTRGALCS
jgi:hypothetical protein